MEPYCCLWSHPLCEYIIIWIYYNLFMHSAADGIWIVSYCFQAFTALDIHVHVFLPCITQGVELLSCRSCAFSILQLITIHYPKRLHQWKLTLEVCASSHDSKFTASTRCCQLFYSFANLVGVKLCIKVSFIYFSPSNNTHVFLHLLLCGLSVKCLFIPLFFCCFVFSY